MTGTLVTQGTLVNLAALVTLVNPPTPIQGIDYIILIGLGVLLLLGSILVGVVLWMVEEEWEDWKEPEMVLKAYREASQSLTRTEHRASKSPQEPR